jgi:hypothetical protein
MGERSLGQLCRTALYGAWARPQEQGAPRVAAERFEAAWYLEQYPDVAASGLDPLFHYLEHGLAEGRSGNAEEDARRTKAEAFDRAWYLDKYADVAASGLDPLFHYLEYGLAEGRSGNAEEDARRTKAEAFDRAWYLEKYADVAASGLDPLLHYFEHGLAEGRSGNAEEDAWHARCESFDPDWYLKRYPDVARAMSDPLQHFRNFGLYESRAGNPTEDCETGWKERFDPVWYLARNPELVACGMDPMQHFLALGLKEGRAPNSAEESRAAWKERFDPVWYMGRYPEVALAGMDPLEHFLSHGLVEGRRPNGIEKSPYTPVEQSKLVCIKQLTKLRTELALFVAVATNGRLKPHVEHYLRALVKENIGVALVVAADAPLLEISHDLVDKLDAFYIRENRGYDFAAWAHLLRVAPEILNVEILYLVNDSVFGPFNQQLFSRLLEQIRLSSSDLIGLTENVERGWHLQSYFLAAKKAAIRSQSFGEFFGRIVAFESKDDVIDEYETQLASLLTAAGLRCSVLFPTPTVKNPMVLAWRDLVAAGLPFLKVITARKAKGLDDWRTLLKSEGYDPAVADATLAELPDS